MIIMFFLVSSSASKTGNGFYNYIQNTLTSLVNYVAPRAPEKSTDYTVDTSAFSLQRMQSAVALPQRLAARKEAEPSELLAALKLREASYGKLGTVVDTTVRRQYNLRERKPVDYRT